MIRWTRCGAVSAARKPKNPPNDVVTTGGVIGEVIHIKDDHVTIRSAESRLLVLRSGIANITNRTPAAEAKAEVKPR